MAQTMQTLKDPIISESCIEIKIELNFYFHTSLWCLKRFYEGLEGFIFLFFSAGFVDDEQHKIYSVGLYLK